VSWERITHNHHKHVETGRNVNLTQGAYICTLDTGFIIGQCANKTEIGNLLRKRLPEDQTVDEWLADFNKLKG
jgi:hypothetical protein